MTNVIHVGQYVRYRSKIYEVVETNRLNNTAKLRYNNQVTESIAFDELEEVPF